MCGSLRVQLDDRRLESELVGRRGQLVAYLAVNRGRAVRREELIDALWPTDPPARPEAAFATLLTRTRAIVGHDVIRGGAHLHLELGADARVDWEVAQRAADEARRALTAGDPASALAVAEAGAAIVRQGFLPEYEAPWIDDRRRDLDALCAPLAESLARAALALGGDHVATAERAARAMIDQNPYREAGYAALMEALAAGGNDAEALRTYDQLRSLLREQLGLTPSPAVTALAERVLRQSEPEPAPAAPAPPPASTTLPADMAALAQRPLVGRGPERERLLEVSETVARGERRVVLVCGEPGIGKTRLAIALADAVQGRGWSVLYGRADRDSAVSYQPVIEALRHHLAQGAGIDPRIQEMMAPELAALSRMLPALRPLAGTSVEAWGAEPDLERFRVFEAVAALIASATADHPALLVLDDLHWADRSTMTLLRHVIRATAGCRLLVLGTFRDPDDGGGGPLREFVDELWHEGLLEQLTLAGLAPDEAATLVHEHAPEAAPAVVRRLYERTDGNPFYIEETLRGMADAPAAVPSGHRRGESFIVPERIKQMIEWRVERLPAPAPAALKAAAVLGATFEVERTAAVSAVATDDLLDGLESARRAGLIMADAERPDHYAFRHALVREALYDAIPPSRRARLHLTSAQVLERTSGGPAAEIAAHYSHALAVGGADAAVRWRLLAADEATLRHAYEEAYEHRRHAMVALDTLAPDDRLRATILLGQGQSLIRGGDLEAGQARVLEAAALARRLAAVDILADCALEVGSFYLPPGTVEEDVVELLEEALRGLDAVEDSARRARVMARLVVARYWDPASRHRCQDLAEEAVRLAAADGDPCAIAQATGSRHSAHWVSQQPEPLLQEAELTIELAQRASDHELELVARTWRLNHLLALARVEEADEEIERFSALAQRLGQARCTWYAPLFLGLRAMMGGRLAQAEQHIMTAAELGSRVPGSTSGMLAGAQLFFLRTLQGRLAELEEAVTAFVQAFPRLAAWRCGAAFLQSQLGRHERARELVDGLAGGGLAAIPADNIWLVAVTLLGEAAAVSGAGPHLANLEGLLAPHAGVCILSPDAAWLGPVDRVLGLLTAAQDRLDEAAAHQSRAIEICERARAASLLALARTDHAEVLLRRNREGDRSAARALARGALALAEGAGMQRVAARALAILAEEEATADTARPSAETALAG